MSAADHIHPGQLAMLMPAHEVGKLRYGDSYVQTELSRGHMIDQKRSDNARKSMEPYMDQPIKVFHREEGPTVWDGHHRMVHALDTDPNREMLVTHDSDEAVGHRWKQDAEAGRQHRARAAAALNKLKNVT